MPAKGKPENAAYARQRGKEHRAEKARASGWTAGTTEPEAMDLDEHAAGRKERLHAIDYKSRRQQRDAMIALGAATAAEKHHSAMIAAWLSYEDERSARLAEDARKQGAADVETALDDAFRRLPRPMQARLLKRWTG